jgi:hypothetical protein
VEKIGAQIKFAEETKPTPSKETLSKLKQANKKSLNECSSSIEN